MDGCAIGPISQCQVTSKWPFTTTAMLVASSPHELEEGAKALGLKPAWVHSTPTMRFYRLTRDKAVQAERMGARPVSQSEADRMAFAIVRAAAGAGSLFTSGS